MIKEEFRRYLVEAIGEERSLVAFAAFDEPASVSLRLNPLKPCRLPYDSEPVSWSPYGRVLSQRPVFTLDPLFHAGAYYVQDSSSMFVGHLFRGSLKKADLPTDRPVRVLDLCAAPGGKSTDLAASLRSVFSDRFLLVSNEVMKQRVGVLADNMALWGDPNVVVTSDDPSAFSSLAGFFDVIIADVPCSGEGMFRKDEQAQKQWSEDNVALCASRQRRIVADVWPSLRKGGLFIYSTCTFNVHENDGNASWIADELGAEILIDDGPAGQDTGVIRTEAGYSLVPGFVSGEGQYCSALVKTAETETRDDGRKKRSRQTQASSNAVPQGLDRLFASRMKFRQKGDMLIAVPESLEEDVSVLERQLHLIATGCAVGSMKGRDLVPDADLALCTALSGQAWPSVDVDRETALAYLHRDNLTFPDAPRGYLLVRYQGLPLGFVKNIGNRCNSLHPQSRRIRMNIK